MNAAIVPALGLRSLGVVNLLLFNGLSVLLVLSVRAWNWSLRTEPERVIVHRRTEE